MKPNGEKNSAGGAEPDRSSPMTGDNKYRTSAGGNLFFTFLHVSRWSAVLLYIQGYVVHILLMYGRVEFIN